MFSRRRRLLLLSSSSLVLLSCWASIAAAQTQNAQQQTPSQGAEPTAPSPPAVPPGTTPVPEITVTPPPTRPARRVPPREAPSTQAPMQRATAPPPPRTQTPSNPAANAANQAPSTAAQTAMLDQQRDNIFAPLGTAPTTLSREAIESLPQGTNSTVRDVLLQLPGVTQDSAASGNLHVRNEHANVSYRINGILLPDGLGAFGQFLDSSFIGSLSLITGALPAQYGLRTAGIVDITTATFNNAGQIGVYGGSRGTTSGA